MPVVIGFINFRLKMNCSDRFRIVCPFKKKQFHRRGALGKAAEIYASGADCCPKGETVPTIPVYRSAA
jgi:hypothetical protein